MLLILFFFSKQKPAYDVRISDWSSDVCSSDLLGGDTRDRGVAEALEGDREQQGDIAPADLEGVQQRGHVGAVDVCLLALVVAAAEEIGRASCRERGCQYVKI